MSNLNYEIIIEKLTKKTFIQQQKLIKLFGKLNIQQQIEIMNNKNSLFHKIREKNKEIDKSTLTLVAFYISIDEFVINLTTIDKNLIKFKNRKQKETITPLIN